MLVSTGANMPARNPSANRNPSDGAASTWRPSTIDGIRNGGRHEQFDPARDRLTLTEVRRKILEQTKLFRPEDVIPVPCHPDRLAMAYALKSNGNIIPPTGLIDPKILIEGGRNTIIYESDATLQHRLFKLFSTNHSPGSNKAARAACPRWGSTSEA